MCISTATKEVKALCMQWLKQVFWLSITMIDNKYEVFSLTVYFIKE